MEDNFTYQFRKLIKYTPKGSGEFAETGMIEFTPPSMEVFDESTDFDQLIMRAMMSAAQLAPNSDKDIEAKLIADGDVENGNAPKIPDSSELKSVLNASSVSMKDIARCFKKLACKTGYLDQKTLIKESHFKKMTKEDFIGMMCGYAAFFTFPSLFRGD